MHHCSGDSEADREIDKNERGPKEGEISEVPFSLTDPFVLSLANERHPSVGVKLPGVINAE